MSRQKLNVALMIALAVVVQAVLLPAWFDELDHPWRLGMSFDEDGLQLHGDGLPWQLGMLIAHALLIFVAGWGVPSRSTAGPWKYAAGYAALFVVLILLAADPLFFLLAVMLYAAVYHIPALLATLFLFVISFSLLAPYHYAIFALSVPVMLGLMGLYRGKAGAFMIGAQFIGFLLLIAILMPLAYMISQTSPQDIFKALGRKDVRDAILLSLQSSTITTFIILILGVPLAYVMTRTEFPGKSFVDNALDLPILIPQPVVAIAILTFMGSKTNIGRFLASFGLEISGTIWGIVAAQVFVSTPFLVRAAMTAFDGVDPKLEKVARTLGARPWRAFLTVSLPLAAKGIFAGCILTWSRAISEFGAVAMITYDPASAPVKIYDEVTSRGVAEARPIAVLLVFTCLWIFIILRLIRTYPVGGMLADIIRGRYADTIADEGGASA